MKMDTYVTNENIKKEIGWDNSQPGTSGMDTNSDEHRRIGSITVDSDDGSDESQMDIPFKDQTEIKQEVNYECENPAQEVEWVLNKAISEQTNLKLEEIQCFTDQNVSQYNNTLKEPISDLTDEPVIHVICPQNESDVIFESKNNSETSRKTSSAEFRHGPSVCVKKFGTQSDLTSHKFNHICGKRFNTKESLEQHRRCCHMFQCPDCRRIFCTSSSRQPLEYECPACGPETFQSPVTNCSKTFEHKRYIERHLKNVHVIPPICKPYQCIYCNKDWITCGRLKRHMSVHKRGKPFKCTVEGCEKMYKTENTRKRHMQQFHSEPAKSSC